MNPLKPFFPFYGSKWRSAKLYGPPRHNHVIEPFAGSAGYSTYWNPLNVTLVEKDPVIVGVWHYIQRATAGEISKLPDLEVGEDVQALTRLPQEARHLIGFWLNRGSAVPKRRRTAFSARTDKAQLVWGPRARERLMAQAGTIQHWRIIESSYEGLQTKEATYFVDPPYIDKGRFYRERYVDYQRLGTWCQSLPGQIVVCENAGATWLPFSPLATIKSTKGTSAEVVWERDNNSDPVSSKQGETR